MLKLIRSRFKQSTILENPKDLGKKRFRNFKKMKSFYLLDFVLECFHFRLGSCFYRNADIIKIKVYLNLHKQLYPIDMLKNPLKGNYSLRKNKTILLSLKTCYIPAKI